MEPILGVPGSSSAAIEQRSEKVRDVEDTRADAEMVAVDEGHYVLAL